MQVFLESYSSHQHLGIVAEKVAEKNLELVFEYQANVPGLSNGDSISIRQVISCFPRQKSESESVVSRYYLAASR